MTKKPKVPNRPIASLPAGTHVHGIELQLDPNDIAGYEVVDLGEYGWHFAHDVATLLMTGNWPKSPVVHRNGNRSDNHWENIKPLDKSEVV